jgi:large subunit ribosomal protein L4
MEQMTMKVDVVNMAGKKVKSVELPAEIFEAPIIVDLMHQAFVRQMANAHLGTHETKTKSDASGGGHKPWRQKGTGRARQGSTRSAQWRGGGKIHTPHMRSYVVSMPRKMRQAALRSALSSKAAEQQIVIVDELKLEEPKTRFMAGALTKLVGESSALVLIPSVESYEGVIRSTNNIPDAKVLHASYLNIRDLFVFDKLLIPVAALDLIKANLG